MTESTELREIATATGRVYQRYEGSVTATIDWTPPTSLHGYTRLTGGKVDQHLTEGKIVTFEQRVKQGRKSLTVSARLTGRPDLEELVRIASAMEAELRAAKKAHDDRTRAEHEAKKAADVAAFEATLPPDYVAIEKVDHSPDAADGWGMTTYRHGGVEIDVLKLGGPGIVMHHHPLKNPYDLRAYAPAEALKAEVARARALKAAKDAARAAKAQAEADDRRAKIAQARETGQPVQLERWTESCDGSVDECSTDIVYRMAQPDGTVTTERIHTH